MTQTKFQQHMNQTLQEKTILEQAKQYAFDYLDGVSDRRVSPDSDALAGLVAFDEPMPQQPQYNQQPMAQPQPAVQPATQYGQQPNQVVAPPVAPQPQTPASDPAQATASAQPPAQVIPSPNAGVPTVPFPPELLAETTG